MTDNLLLEIARCTEVKRCLAGNSDHPCAGIVAAQAVNSLTDFQVPEPWSGQIATAPILFLSSNPSISRTEVYPRWHWDDNDVVDFFNNRFGGGRRAWVRRGTKSLREDGSYGRATMFWAAIRKRAIELLERDVRPGIDYALTEIVHCKSRSETGVASASEHCATKYLERTLALASAVVIVVLGDHARRAFTKGFELAPSHVSGVVGPFILAGHERMVAFLPHPNAHRPRTFAACLNREELEHLRGFLHRGVEASQQ